MSDWAESEAMAEAFYNSDTGMPGCWQTDSEGARERYRRNCAAALRAALSLTTACATTKDCPS